MVAEVEPAVEVDRVEMPLVAVAAKVAVNRPLVAVGMEEMEATEN